MNLKATRQVRGTAIAIAVVIGGGLAAVAITRGAGNDKPLRSLIQEANALDERFLVGRIDGVAYRRPEHTTRSTQSDSLPRLRLRTAAVEILQRDDVASDAAGRHAIGIAQLFAGNVDESIQVLHDAAARPDASARVWNDLAAAILQRAARENDPREATYSLAATNRALELDPRMASALYNRVLALDTIGLQLVARDAAENYLAVDAGSEWSREVRERLREWSMPTRTEEWKKAVTELERATERGDEAAVAVIVQKFPQQSRSWGEGEFLGRWSDAVKAEQSGEAKRWLAAARSIAYHLVKTNGAGELRAIVDHLDADDKTEGVATAFQTYRSGRIALDRRKVGEAVPRLREAQSAFERAGSPLALFAAHYLTVALLDANDVQESARTLSHLDDVLKPEYPALRAQCDWHRANLLARQGRLYETLSAAQRALAGFERLREENHRARMLSAVANTLSRLGRTQEAWRMRSAALRAVTQGGDLRGIEVALNSTVRQAIREKEWTVARALLDAQLARGISSPRLRVDALLWRTFVNARLRHHDGTADDMQAAQGAAQHIQDRNLRDEALADVRFGEAVISRGKNPTHAIELLDEVVGWRERNGGADLSIAYVERARAHRALDHADAALADLTRAISIMESQREEIARDDIRDAFFGSAEDAYHELIDLLLDRRDPGGAFAASERMRARVVLDRLLGKPSEATAIPDAPAIQRRLPAGVRIVHLTVLPQRTLVVTIDRNAWSAEAVRVARTEVGRLRDALSSAITSAQEPAARSAGRKLYDILLSRVATRDGEVLVLVPDETSAEIPFSALVNPQGQFLIEQTAVTTAPSAAAFVGQAHAGRELNLRRDRALIVGDPAFDKELFPRLPRLGSAAEEVRALTAMLPHSSVLTDTEATRRSFLAQAPNSAIVHIAAHAMTNRTNPAASFIVLAGTGRETGLLHQRDIALDDFRATQLVVLAGCRTAVASNAPGSVRSLAMAFIAAGSRNVLGSLWDIDDAAATELSLRFYRHLASDPRPAAALRLAQLDMLRSSNTEHRAVRIWSALQIYGSGI